MGYCHSTWLSGTSAAIPQGAQPGYDKTVGLGQSVVVDLVSHLPEGPPFHIYFDNLFTGLHLLHALAEKSIGGTGTTRSNRIENCPIKIKTLAKETRGSYDYRHTHKDNTIVCSWNENAESHCHPSCMASFVWER